MQTKITLRILNVDLDDDETVECIAEHLSDFSWSVVDGITKATLFIAGNSDVVSQAVDSAHHIENKIAGSRVDEVDEELVAIPDISARSKIHRETVRSWINGTRGPGNFPVPAGSFGGGDRGSMKVWRWPDVNRWLEQHYALGDGYSYPTRKEYAEINAFLAHAEYMLTVSLPNAPHASVMATQIQYLTPKDAALVTLGVAGVREFQNVSTNLLIKA